MKIAILCVGSEGDVRPFLALGVGLKADGHEVIIFANPPNERLCLENGFTFVPLAGDLTALLNSQNSEVALGKIQVIKKIKKIIKDSLFQQFEVLFPHLQHVDGVIYHPAVFAAEHLIEALRLPSARVQFQPDIRSKYYACCIFPPKMPFQRLSNLASHFIAAQLFWLPVRGVVNEWRTERLGLTKLGVLSPRDYGPFWRIPKLIAVSQALVPSAPDWSKNVHVTGYLQLAKGQDWAPPEILKRFLQAGPAPLYIGFGSLTQRCDSQMSEVIVDTLKQFHHRVILCGPFAHIKKEQLPHNVLQIDAAPHDWLFPKVGAVVHHGGSGTTHAALLAGKPALVVPFVVDQFHWGEAIYKNGLGPKPLPASKLARKTFQKALEDLLLTQSYHVAAIDYSTKMKEENGVQQALQFFYQECQESARL